MIDRHRRPPRLLDRRNEHAVLDAVLAGVRAGQSQVLVLRGEAGVGKSALLEYLRDSASDCLVARSVGVESEMELAYAVTVARGRIRRRVTTTPARYPCKLSGDISLRLNRSPR